MSGLRVFALRRFYRVAYRLLWLRGLLWPRRGSGVKCLLTRGQEVLLVRHTYGRRREWQLPGGASRRGESPLETAAREMGEELGLVDLAWRILSRAEVRLEHMSVDLTCVQAELEDPAVRPDPVEIEQARWFGLRELPRPLGSEVLGALDLLLPFEHQDRAPTSPRRG